MSESMTTTDHQQIRHWAEQRDGHPAAVKATKSDGDPGILRIDFEDGAGEESLERIDWDTFFRKFDEEELAFLYQETTEDGSISRFCKLVERDGQ